jgi:thiol:disulfide interchange protein
VAANDSDRFRRFKAHGAEFLLQRGGGRLGYSARMKISVVALFLLLAGSAAAKPWWLSGPATNEDGFLDPNVAFRVSAGVDGNAIRVRWIIADGYYLYRQKIEIRPESPDLTLAAPQLPPGLVKVDPYLGRQEIYQQQVQATVPYSRTDAGAHPLQIKVTYQGCAEAGLCYPPITKVLYPAHPLTGAAPADTASANAASPPHPWEGAAILGGVFAFLWAGLMLRKGRKLEMPAA